jgi:hypothetical protein
VRNCLTDEGRPLGTGLQGQVPNHLRRLWSKAMVVSTEGKGLARPGQVTGKKRTAREPLWKCRKQRDEVKTAGGLLLRDQALTKPVYGRSGIRHERWPELAKEAVERNVGT